MSSDKSLTKSARSHSIHVAIGRDFDRMKILQKQDLKHEKEFHLLERKLNSHAKWNQRADQKNLLLNGINNTSTPEQPPMTLEQYMQKEKVKQENIANAKKLANERIRPN